MTAQPWTFGVDPLPQTVELAGLLRHIAGLAMALEHEEQAVDELLAQLRTTERALRHLAPADLRPRVGPDAPAGRRIYVDHGRGIGAYNPCFPEYELHVDGSSAHGTVSFPIAFEGPPGVVHGGVLATFFDCVIQHHNCEVGVAGKTTSLHLAYQRPTPLARELHFRVQRDARDRRITSRAELLDDGTPLCHATVEAVAGDRANLPEVSPRRGSP